jgi:hypothetical protein
MRHLKLWSLASIAILSMLGLSACDDIRAFGAFQGLTATAPTITGPASPLTAGSTGTPFGPVNFQATGTAPISWSVTAGALPPGITLSTSGVYSGTPTAGGTFSFTVTATNDGGMDSDPYTHTIMGGAVDSNALLSNNSLAALAAATPGGIEGGVAVTGLNAGDTLVSIDRRPQNGFLYALGYNATAGTVQLYAVSSTTAVATPVGTTGSFVAADGITPVTVGMGASTVFGIDFNPTVDRVRVVNSAGQNFRMNPNNGAFVDGNAMAANLQMDGAINGPTTGVQETAYTNNAPNVTITTQHTLDSTTDALCIQNPPNNGTQTLCQALSSLVDSVLGFDIRPGVDTAASNTPVAAGTGFAVLQLTGQTGTFLSSIDLTNGSLGTPTAIPATGIIGFTVQQPLSTSMVALSADGTQLIRFLSASPSVATTVAITGITAGETLVGIDYRPQTGQLYSFGVNDTANTGTVYVLDPQTGAATVVGTASQVAFVDGSGVAVDLPPASSGYGFDFNPTVDRMRIVTDSGGLNFRLNPVNGAAVDGNLNNTASPPAGTNTDGPINALPAGATGVSAAAYTNSFGQSLTGGVTTQFVIDASSDTLFIQNPPNAGTLTSPMAITVGGAPLDFNTASGFDIPSNVRVTTSNTAPPTGSTGFAALTVAGATRLYSINLLTGAATDLGALAANVSGLAAGQTTVR